MNAPWTEAHRREAMRWLCAEIGALEGAHLPVTIGNRDVASEDGFRRAIVREIDIAEQDAAVRRVRDLAEGRRVRETGERWEAWLPGSAQPESDDEAYVRQRVLDNGGAVVHVRITRIRRAR